MKASEKLTEMSVFLEPDVHLALKAQATETSTSVSGLINAAVREELRSDKIDLTLFDEHSDETTITFEELVERLRR